MRDEDQRVRPLVVADPNVVVCTAREGADQRSLGVLQQSVSAAVQMSVPLGFGWGLAGAQWKRRPVVVGRYGMLPEQAAWGRAGTVVGGAPDAANALLRLLKEPELAVALGNNGRTRLKERHLITLLLRCYTALFRRLLERGLAPAMAPFLGRLA
jgi:hypothetical protein